MYKVGYFLLFWKGISLLQILFFASILTAFLTLLLFVGVLSLIIKFPVLSLPTFLSIVLGTISLCPKFAFSSIIIFPFY